MTYSRLLQLNAISILVELIWTLIGINYIMYQLVGEIIAQQQEQPKCNIMIYQLNRDYGALLEMAR